MGAISIAGAAACTTLWAMPFPRVIFSTIAIAFGFAAVWSFLFLMSVRSLRAESERFTKPGAKLSGFDVFLVLIAILSFLFAVKHSIDGARAIGDVRFCLREATAWECHVTVDKLTAEQTVEIKKLIEPYQGIHFSW
ncbi:MAG: hypothetical protein C0519_01390 [Hyphomicrobium sp.]|nr:hypothetical protein [Hyphomicrobium sp.]PPD09550.1 MAG: hypothetical protein CTY28_01715 [Hyphomicrobium sp.]